MMTDRRQLKTHLRLDALVFSPKTKYIYIGRDGRDCYMSLVNHYRNANDFYYASANDKPGRVGPPFPRFNEETCSEKVLFDRWISEGWPTFADETDGYPYWSVLDHVRSWWKHRHQPNILFLHYADMLENTEAAVREITAFLGIPIQAELLPGILQAVSLEGMRENLLCVNTGAFAGGKDAFVFKGQNGRWKGLLSAEQLEKYDRKVKEKLLPECAAWLENGKKGFHLNK
jgi:aryl sulfotransferase